MCVDKSGIGEHLWININFPFIQNPKGGDNLPPWRRNRKIMRLDIKYLEQIQLLQCYLFKCGHRKLRCQMWNVIKILLGFHSYETIQIFSWKVKAMVIYHWTWFYTILCNLDIVKHQLDLCAQTSVKFFSEWTIRLACILGFIILGFSVFVSQRMQNLTSKDFPSLRTFLMTRGSP